MIEEIDKKEGKLVFESRYGYEELQIHAWKPKGFLKGFDAFFEKPRIYVSDERLAEIFGLPVTDEDEIYYRYEVPARKAGDFVFNFEISYRPTYWFRVRHDRFARDACAKSAGVVIVPRNAFRVRRRFKWLERVPHCFDSMIALWPVNEWEVLHDYATALERKVTFVLNGWIYSLDILNDACPSWYDGAIDGFKTLEEALRYARKHHRKFFLPDEAKPPRSYLE